MNIKEMIAKLLKNLVSKKLLITVATFLVNYLIAKGILPIELKLAVMGLITAIASLYVKKQADVDKEEVVLKEKEVEKEIEEIRKSNPL